MFLFTHGAFSNALRRSQNTAAMTFTKNGESQGTWNAVVAGYLKILRRNLPGANEKNHE
jgi:hypothetical protein